MKNTAAKQFENSVSRDLLEQLIVDSTPKCLRKCLLISVPAELTGAYH